MIAGNVKFISETLKFNRKSGNFQRSGNLITLNDGLAEP